MKKRTCLILLALINLNSAKMKKSLLLAILIVPFFALSQIINIPIDYPTIQQGIDVANTGDTVLVSPGTYIENINLNGKNITVASHYLTTTDTSYISQTIIDGNQESCVVVFNNSESELTKLCGFTIVNGKNFDSWPLGCGGGILTYYSSPILDNLIIKNNTSVEYAGGGVACFHGEPILTNLIVKDNFLSTEGNNIGGGIYLRNSAATVINVQIIGNTARTAGGIYIHEGSPFLENVLIKNNIAIESAGGMRCFESFPILSNVTIKYNTANSVGGILIGWNSPTFDSINRCNIYSNTSLSRQNGREINSNVPINILLDTFSVLYPTEYYVKPLDNFIFDIKYGIVDQFDSDVYVSPEGDDSNVGLSENEPLQTIKNTIPRMRADSLHHYTIYLMEGEYCQTNNDEQFPICLPSYIDIIGLIPSTVVLNAEDQSNVLLLENNVLNKLSFLTVSGGYTDGTDGSGGTAGCGGGISILNSNIKLNNLIITDNYSGGMGGGISCWSSNVELLNLVLINNSAYNWGGGLWCYYSNLTMNNSLVFGNNVSNTEGGGMGISQSNAKLNNVTITNNSSNNNGGGIYLGGFYSYNNSVWLTNTIVWNNSFNEIAMDEPQHAGNANDDKLYCLHSNIEGGEEEIIPQLYDMVFWLEGNINEDPIFNETGNFPYSLQNESPCINTGTLDTTGLFLQPYDIIGNPRIWDDRIDIGAYEWNSLGEDEIGVRGLVSGIRNYPNPFSTSTTLEFELTQSKKIELRIYNQLGELIEIIQKSYQPGKLSITWGASGLPSGIYFARLQIDNELMMKKIIKL